MPDAKLLLSSTERKALFKSAQDILRQSGSFYSKRISEYADDLCEKLDDGGIWNPCFVIVNDSGETDEDNAAFAFLFVLNHSSEQISEYEYRLKMIKDRYLYTNDRSVRKSAYDLPPFLTASDYYGPNWSSKREDAIERDGFQCSSCGLSREKHYEKFDQDLHVHHIKPLRSFGDYTLANELCNLETLCFDCHKRREN